MTVCGHFLYQLAFVLLLTSAPFRTADETAVNASIRAEEEQHSQINRIIYYLSDLYGPRLTGSPSAKAASEWALAQMRNWGLQNEHLEPWLFEHPGWRNVDAVGAIVSPLRAPLSFRVVAWTPGTHGIVAADATVIHPPEQATQAQLDQFFTSLRGQLRNRIVMVGEGTAAEPETAPSQLDDDLIAQLKRGELIPQPAPEVRDPKLLTGRQISEQLDTFLIKAGALMRVNDAQEAYGIVRAFANFTYETTKALPTVELRNEDYGRVARLVANGTPVHMRFNIRNQLNEDGRVAYNTVAEIPGSDKKDEVIILGAHLDSWHSATGAVDDGIGCAMIMEAVRIFEALHLRPRRTIRIVLWTGEEQFLLGSQDYVARHFGTAEVPGPEFSKLAAYINIDGGTGRIRGANMFGPAENAGLLRDILQPFADLGFVGAIPHSARRLGSTDATTFSRAGLPSIGLIQDPLDYHMAWHSQLDTPERINESQAKQSATMIAALAYALAMREGLPARFNSTTMPSPLGPSPQARPLAK